MTRKLLGLAAVLGASAFLGGCNSSAASRDAYVGDYAGFLAVATNNTLVPGDVITESNNYGAFYFELGATVTKARVELVGAAGSATKDGADLVEGGSGGTGIVELEPSFLTAKSATGFWAVLGQAGRASAGETTPLTNFLAFNGGGAGTDWSSAENLFTSAAGGGGASDLRLAVTNGDKADPHAAIDPCAGTDTRFAVVGGGGGATLNMDPPDAWGGFGGGFNNAGGDGAYGTDFGVGASTSAGGGTGLVAGSLCYGGNGLQDGNEGWAGGGGGGYYGGGAAVAHGGGGGGSGYLLTAAGLTQVSTTDGTQGANGTTTQNGKFVITVE